VTLKSETRVQLGQVPGVGPAAVTEIPLSSTVGAAVSPSVAVAEPWMTTVPEVLKVMVAGVPAAA